MFEYKQVGQRLQLVAFEHFRALSACAALRLGLSIAAPYALAAEEEGIDRGRPSAVATP